MATSENEPSRSQPTSANMWSALTSGSAIIRSKSPEAILALFEPHLTERQKLELTTMDEIWYFTLDDGEEETSRGGIWNHGYDDQEHNYIPVKHEQFNYRFELGRKIGQGGQGVVVQCLDHKTKTPVALKILTSPTHLTFEAHQMMELRMSMELQTVRSDVDYNVVNVMDIFYFRGHKCIVMELLKKSLHQVLIDMGEWRIDEDDLKSYARGIVRFLAYTKSRGIVHGDIKPGNVLLKNNSSRVVRVTDFGFSFFVDQQPSLIGGTLPYMAPEVVLGYPATCAMDMWSLGCTVAKLAIRKELFVSDMDNDHVACCIEILGMPPKRMVEKAPYRASYFDPFGRPHWPSRSRPPGSVPLHHVLQGCGAQLMNFVKCCLQVEMEEKPLSSSSSSLSLLDHIYGEWLEVVEEELKEEEEKEGEETEKDEDKDKEEKDKDGNQKDKDGNEEEGDKDGNEEKDKHEEEDTTECRVGRSS
ncbi:dual specificity tyrosine-phosphorylation-regulated kinase 2-like [Petromyzon marinus]|uniref:dual specificity tyrosine-phosphorylation-regulated kinase 2-like n=1 Tax=Petromyzon marinus TaxID=7757 RepID=UPI003F6F3542